LGLLSDILLVVKTAEYAFKTGQKLRGIYDYLTIGPKETGIQRAKKDLDAIVATKPQEYFNEINKQIEDLNSRLAGSQEDVSGWITNLLYGDTGGINGTMVAEQTRLVQSLRDAAGSIAGSMVQAKQKGLNAQDIQKIADVKLNEMTRTAALQKENEQRYLDTLDERKNIEETFDGKIRDLEAERTRAKSATLKSELEKAINFEKTLREKALKEYDKKQEDERLATEEKIADERQRQYEEEFRNRKEYERSLADDLKNMQQQILAGFSGLQQSVFPKEAMNYLRQIAGASNKFP
jgi:hypothetical protein